MDQCLTNSELLKLLKADKITIKEFVLGEESNKKDVVNVVRCKHCAHASHPETRVIWCKRQRNYMPLNGFCSYGDRKVDGE